MSLHTVSSLARLIGSRQSWAKVIKKNPELFIVVLDNDHSKTYQVDIPDLELKKIYKKQKEKNKQDGYLRRSEAKQN